jgi:hypothetical protein
MFWTSRQYRNPSLDWHLTLVMVGTFLLPLFGPLLDHQYADQQPLHQHLYLDSINLLHHGHHQSDEVVSMPGLETTGPSALSLFLPFEQAVTLPLLPNGELALGFADEISFSQGISPAPLERPPR